MDKKKEIEEKTERLVRTLAAKRLGGVLINTQHNFSWLTCGGSNCIDQSRETGAGALFVRNDGRRFVLANRIEMPRLLGEELDGQDYEPVEFGWEEERSSASLLADRARSLLANSWGVGSDTAIAGAQLIEPEVARARYQLTDGEVDRLRALGRDSAAAVEEVIRGLEPGLSEREIARRAADALAARGCRTVVNLVAADDRLARFRHPIPNNREWRELVMVVVCARRGGLTVALTRIASARPVPDQLQRKTRATAQVAANLFASTRPGATGRELYEVAAASYRELGFAGEERLHHQGGAMGYRTRDWIAHPASDEVVQERQAFGWNPSITGTKVEETCIAFADRIEVVTSGATWPRITVQSNSQSYSLPAILSLS